VGYKRGVFGNCGRVLGAFFDIIGRWLYQEKIILLFFAFVYCFYVVLFLV
jgi:hypothetical protein